MEGFLQTPPLLPNAWTGDRVLRETLQWILGDDQFDAAMPRLSELGALVTAPETLALAATADKEPPRHIPYSAWGQRIDEIVVSPAYSELGRMGVRAGVTSLPYEQNEYGPAARVVWGAVLLLWGPSSALYSCPIAMTDGAARTLLLHGGAEDLEVVSHLTTSDPARAWTSGQWMTETAGGSDISGTETTARLGGDGVWRLYGRKWFTSATTSEVALTLARPEGAPAGSRGLALWLVARRDANGQPNGIVVRRLKDKLGTRAMPTAELDLVGAAVRPVGDPFDGGGVRRIATMLNLTRIHNALGSAGALGRGLAWARSYASVRRVGGKPLSHLPVHQATLTDLAVDYAAAVALALRCCELAGRVEHGTARAEEAQVLRALTPIAKLATARWAVAGVAECMEALGGVGYCEDSTLPALVRDAHVMPIWEGTTNVLSLDVSRAARSGAVTALLEDVRTTLGPLSAHPAVGETATTVLAAADVLEGRIGATHTANPAEARSSAMSLGNVYACARLTAQGAWAADRGDLRTAAAARRLAARGLVQVGAPDELYLGMDEAPQQSTL